MSGVIPSGPYWDRAAGERNWLLYRLVPRNGGKTDKQPADPNTGRSPISVHVAAQMRLDQALAAAGDLTLGIGYLARPGSTLIAADLDDCMEDGALAPWASDLVRLCSSWVERSPSGTGLRVLAARQFSGAPEIDTEGNGVGLFAAGGRFATVTFDLLPRRQRFVCSAPALVRAILNIRAKETTLSPCPSKSAAAPPPAQSSDAFRWFDPLSEGDQMLEVERMLDCLVDARFGEYELWLKISFAVYRATDSMGFEAWDRWCRKLPGYDAAENARKWERGFRDRPGLIATVGTLIHHARQHGYHPPLHCLHQPLPNVAEVLSRHRRARGSS